MKPHKIVCVLLPVTFLLNSCDSAKKGPLNESKVDSVVLKNKNDTPNYRDELNKVASIIPYSSIIPNGNDSSLFVFYKRTDRYYKSWSLSAIRVGDVIRINFNEVIPESVADNFDPESDPIHYRAYEGSTCDVTFSYWNDLLKRSGIYDYIVDNKNENNAAIDPNYILFFNKKAITSNETNQPFLLKLDSLFNKELFQQFKYKRAHPIVKFDKETQEANRI